MGITWPGESVESFIVSIVVRIKRLLRNPRTVRNACVGVLRSLLIKQIELGMVVINSYSARLGFRRRVFIYFWWWYYCKGKCDRADRMGHPSFLTTNIYIHRQ